MLSGPDKRRRLYTFPRMRFRKRLAYAAGALIAAPLAAGLGWAAWERGGDVRSVIPRVAPPVELVAETDYLVEIPGGQRRYREIVLSTGAGEPIRFTLSLPPEMPNVRLPVMVVLAGIKTGPRTLRNVPDPGPNVVLAFEYPLAREIGERDSKIARLPLVRRGAHLVPGQMLAVLRWLEVQPWADSGRVSLLGYSLGAMFLPVVQRTAAAHGVALGPSVMAFGGADTYGLIRHNLHIEPDWARAPAAWLIETLLYRLAPDRHLPYLDGEFLIINGLHDERIPSEFARALQALTPEPKTIVNLDAEHINPGDPELVARVVGISRAWLAERGTVNPYSPEDSAGMSGE